MAIKREPATTPVKVSSVVSSPAQSTETSSTQHASPKQESSSWEDWGSNDSSDYGRGGWGYWYGSQHANKQDWGNSSYGSWHGENQTWDSSYDSRHGGNQSWDSSYDSRHGKHQTWGSSYHDGWWCASGNGGDQWCNWSWANKSNYNYDPQQTAGWQATLCRPGTSDLFDCGTPCKPGHQAQQPQQQVVAAAAPQPAKEPQEEVEEKGAEADEAEQKRQLEVKKHHAKYMRFYRSLESQELRCMRFLPG